MGTRTYSRRGANGERVPTALGIRTGRFQSPSQPMPNQIVQQDLIDATVPVGKLKASITSKRKYPASVMKRIAANQRLLQQIYREQGFNGKPTVVTPDEFRKFVEDPQNVLTVNGNPMFMVRAVNMVENRDDLFYGDTHHVSRQPGWFGTGTYFKLPSNYPYTTSNRSSITNAILNVTTYYIYPTKEYDATRPSDAPPESQRTPATMLAALKPDARTNLGVFQAKTTRGQKLEWEQWVKSIETAFANKYGRSSADLGTMAAALGYDAIYIPPSVRLSQTELMVFNRSKLIMTPLAEGKDTYGQSYSAVSRIFGGI